MSGTRTTPASAATFLGSAVVVVAYASDRGTYDIVAREEAGLIIWFALLLIAALGLLPGRRPDVPVVLALLSLAGLALWTAVSFSWSESDERTLAELARTLHHLGLLALVLVLAGRERWEAVVGGAAAGATVVCGLALGTRLSPAIFGDDETARTFGTNRLSSPLGYWNATGVWAAMTTTLLLAWSAHASTLLVRCLALAATPAVLVVLYLSYSRGAIASLVAGTIIVVVFADRRWSTAAHVAVAIGLGAVVVLVTRAQPQVAGFTGTEGRATIVAALAACAVAGALAAAGTRGLGIDAVRMTRATARRTLTWCLAIAAIAIAVAAFTVVPAAWDDFSEAPLTEQTSADPAARLTNLKSGRYEIFSSAIAEFRAEPLDGSGAGTFEFTWNRDGRTPEFVRDAHSLYLEAFSELGLLGGVLVLLFAGAVVATMVAARRVVGDDPRAAGAIAGCAGGCATFLVAAGVDWMWELTAVAALFVLLAGAAGAATLREARRPGWAARAAISLTAVLAILVILPGLRSATAIDDSEAYVRHGDLTAAARAARDAEESAPWAAGPHLQIALIDERAGRLDDARAQLLAAQEREPTNWRIPFLLSRVEAVRGDAGSALRAYRRARTLRPLGAFFADQQASATPPER